MVMQTNLDFSLTDLLYAILAYLSRVVLLQVESLSFGKVFVAAKRGGSDLFKNC